jgi:hypothetical protein
MPSQVNEPDPFLVLFGSRLLHELYEAGKKLIPPGRLVEVRYEDFVNDE